MYKCTTPSKKEEKLLFNIQNNIYKNDELIRLVAEDI